MIKISNCQFIKNRSKQYTLLNVISIKEVEILCIFISACLFQDNYITVVRFSSTTPQNSFLTIENPKLFHQKIHTNMQER